MYKFIHDLQELKQFYEVILPPLKEEECYFMSLSCRKKYLKESSISFKGSSEMFERRIVRERNWDIFLSSIRKYEAADGAYIDSIGAPLPNEAMVVYMNFNPVDTTKAYTEFLNGLNENTINMILKRGSSPSFFKNIEHSWKTALHHARGTKHYIDIDIDYVEGTKNEKSLQGILDVLKSRNVQFFVVHSHGGYHILMKADTINFNYMAIMKEIQSSSTTIQDIMNNSQGMIGLPGTIMAGIPIFVEYKISNY